MLQSDAFQVKDVTVWIIDVSNTLFHSTCVGKLMQTGPIWNIKRNIKR